MRPITRFTLHTALAAALVSLAATSAAAADYYLKLGDIKGASAARGTAGKQIEVLSWSWGIARKGWDGTIKGSKVDDGAAAPAGRVAKIDNMASKRESSADSLTVPLDRGSVTIRGSLPGCAVGTHYADAVLQTPSARYEFKDAIITSCALSGAGGGGAALPTESISFNYAKIVTVAVPSADNAKVKVRAWDPERKE